jgi:hypothetical protein
MSIWVNAAGKPIVDATGAIINCDTCPCDTPIATCTEANLVFAGVDHIELTGPFWTAFGGICTPPDNCATAFIGTFNLSPSLSDPLVSVGNFCISGPQFAIVSNRYYYIPPSPPVTCGLATCDGLGFLVGCESSGGILHFKALARVGGFCYTWYTSIALPTTLNAMLNPILAAVINVGYCTPVASLGAVLVQ